MTDSNHTPRRRHGARPLADTVLELIWTEREISRAEIARRTQFSRSTVSEIVGTLLGTPLVAEVGAGPSRGGRRPIVLQFQDDAFSILGVEMGANHIGVALTDLRGKVLAWAERDHPVREDPDGTRSTIVDLCEEALEQADRDATSLVGIGVAVPSPVDPQRPDRLSDIVLPKWNGRAGLDDALARYGVPVHIDNDANLGALAEHWWGAGMGVSDFAYVKIATGVGSGHVIDGKIYRGATGVAGEIGHLTVDPQGGPCVCGHVGCLGTVVGATALRRQAEALLSVYPDSSLADGAPTLTAIEDAALDGDPLAIRLAEAAAEHLGVAVAGMLNLMNPSMVVFGGGLARLGDILLEPMRDTVRRRTLVSSVAASELITSQLGPQSIAIGASTLVLQGALADPSVFSRSARQSEAR